MRILWPEVPEVDQRVAWGLSLGLETDAATSFQWGDSGPFKAFVMGSVPHQSAAVIFTNGENGMSIMAELIDSLLPGEHPVFKLLGYPRYVPGGDR
jgi:hypothetical protein